MADQMNHRRPLSFEQVEIRDQFWKPRIQANRKRGLPAVYDQLKQTGRLAAYQLDWRPGSPKPEPHVFWDSDVAKWLEGACYSLMTHPDRKLRSRVDEVVGLILSAQGEDGYLNPHFTVVNPGGRWKNLRDQHELYCAGHLIEAAVAHHRATGDPQFLDGIRRYADLIAQTFGRAEGKIRGYPGHEELELALITLFRHTGEKRYLDLARYFIEERGQQPHYFDEEARRRGEDPGEYWAGTHAYTQSHLPVREQREVVGHAVRGMYLYAGTADLAYELEDAQLVETLQTLWQDLTAHKLYLTGGIGPSQANEGFTSQFDLPNASAYAETCAAIALVFWAQRMLSLDLDSRYADVMESALYNGMLSGVSLSGDLFFYVNPLASEGDHHRQPFYACSCCPTNVNRILPKIGGFQYSFAENELAVHLYMQGEAEMDLGQGAFRLIQETDYPWDGVVCLRLMMASPQTFALKLRLPGWCHAARVFINGEKWDVTGGVDKGYLAIHRLWQTGDKVRLQFLMPVERVYANPHVAADINKVALMRGPLVYCLEAVDHEVPLAMLRLPRDVSFETHFEPGLLQGVVTLTALANVVDLDDWGDRLYRAQPPALKTAWIKAIPYYAWDNRDSGAMRVWLPEA